MPIAFFKISRASFVSRNSRLRRAISLASSDSKLPVPLISTEPFSDFFDSLIHLDKVLLPTPKFAAHSFIVRFVCCCTYRTTLLLKSLSNTGFFFAIFYSLCYFFYMYYNCIKNMHVSLLGLSSFYSNITRGRKGHGASPRSSSKSDSGAVHPPKPSSPW